MNLRSYEGSAEHQQDLAACKASLIQGSRSFLAASRLLPRQVRDPACALYAFCRMADDTIDESDAPNPFRKLEQLQARLDRVYQLNRSLNQVDRSFSWVVHRYDIPKAVPQALLEGFAWDLQKREYETMEDLHHYAARVAGSVGVMMALIMGARDSAALARASDLGVAMQLSNIARDVGEDARNERIYLPLATMRENGIEPQHWLRNPQMQAALKTVIQSVLTEAERLYQRANLGIFALPLTAQPGISLARWIYAEIGRQVARNAYDSVSQRAVVSPKRKLAISGFAVSHWIASLAAEQLRAFSLAHPAALPANQFLLNAVLETNPSGILGKQATRQEGAIPWVLDLLLKLEARR